MSEKPVWYGYLEAGDKSSPVLLDRRLDTGNPGTIYLFNLQRSEILEYKREIVEPKLRELNPEESRLVERLKGAYAEAKRNFRPRGNRIANLPERGQGRAARVEAVAAGERFEEFPAKESEELGEEEWVDEQEED